jgi:CheY-like chemotaxis protein
MNWSVLVVDDEPLTRNLLRLMLEPAGFQVTGVESGAEAMQTVQTLRPDVIVLDLMMPYMDGIEVCRRLRSDSVTAGVPIIMLSGNFHREAIEKGLQAGANRYLAKPMSRTSLIQELRDVLQETVNPYTQPLKSTPPPRKNLSI